MLVLLFITLIPNGMKLQKLILTVILVLLTGTFVQAQDSTVNVIKKKVQSLNIKSLDNIKTAKLMNLKITPQNLADAKEAAIPMIKMYGEMERDSDVLVIVNGVKVSYNDFKSINPKSISSMTVIKDKKALIEYTAVKSCPALVELFTKKYNKAFLIETKKMVAAK